MESVPSIVKEEVCVKEERLENCTDSSGARSEEAAWWPELSVKNELEAGAESLSPPDVPFTDVKPAVLFDLFEDCGTNVQSLEPRSGGEVPLRCPICHITSHQTSTLTAHIQEVHTDSGVKRLSAKDGRNRQKEKISRLRKPRAPATATAASTIRTYAGPRKLQFRLNKRDDPASRAPYESSPSACQKGEISRKNHLCVTCGKQYTNEAYFVEHIQSHADIASAVSTSKTREAHTCDICKKQYKCKHSLSKHIRTHTPNSEMCDNQMGQLNMLKGQKFYKRVCDMVFTYNCACTALHTLPVRTEEEPDSYDNYNRPFREKSQISEHVKNNWDRMESNKCVTVVDNKVLFQHIELLHTADLPFSCKICHLSFREKSLLNAHMNNHGIYKCDQCDKQYKLNSKLMGHERSHRKEKPYRCEICDKRFTAKSTLVTHNKLHTGEKNFACKRCNRRFITRSHLTKHVKRCF